MSKQEILYVVQDIVNSVLNKNDIILTDLTTANQVEGWDSLNHMEIITRIESRFHISFSFMDVVNIENVGDLVNLVVLKQ